MDGRRGDAIVVALVVVALGYLATAPRGEPAVRVATADALQCEPGRPPVAGPCRQPDDRDR